MPDLPGLHLGGEGLPHVLLVVFLVRARVELVQIDVVGAQGLEGGVQLGQHLRGGEMVLALDMALVGMAELGGHDPAVPLPEQGLAHQGLGEMIGAIAFRRVHQVDAQLLGPPQDGLHLGEGVLLPPFAPELPGAHPDNRYPQARFSKNPVFHGGKR